MALADSRADVVVIGGGLAGLTAALDLAVTGINVTLVEARAWLGGATCSFGRHGLTIDNGQHAFLRCAVAYRGLLDRLGVADLVTVQDQLAVTVLAEGGRADVSRGHLPGPLHLAPALARYGLLTRAERIRSAAAFAVLPFAGRGQGAGQPFASWLARHGQRDAELARLWDPLCTLATGLPAAEADTVVAARTISAALLGGRANADIGVPRVPFSQLHTAPAAAALASLGATVVTGCRAVAVDPAGDGRYAVRCEATAGATATSPGSRMIRADGVVVAVPPWDAAAIGPDAATASWVAGLAPVPVISLHVMYEAPVTSLPFAVIAGSPVRWVADKTAAAGLRSGQYLAATVPGADRYVDLPGSQLRAELLPELTRAFPAAAGTGVQDYFVTRERRSRLRQVPGAMAARRPREPLPAGVAMAGAWTDDRWPDTMEGAVRSGHAAAAKLGADLGAGHGGAMTRPPGPAAAVPRPSAAADAGSIRATTPRRASAL